MIERRAFLLVEAECRGALPFCHFPSDFDLLQSIDDWADCPASQGLSRINLRFADAAGGVASGYELVAGAGEVLLVRA